MKHCSVRSLGVPQSGGGVSIVKESSCFLRADLQCWKCRRAKSVREQSQRRDKKRIEGRENGVKGGVGMRNRSAHAPVFRVPLAPSSRCPIRSPPPPSPPL
eukprot:2849354-Rhodomonas_salina.3